MFETKRVVFDVIIRKYKEYLELYAFFNKGSTQGSTPFPEFYWRYTYHTKYVDPEMVKDRGY